MMILSATLATLNGVIPPISVLFLTEVVDLLLKPLGDDFISEAKKWSLGFLGLGVGSMIFYMF